MPQLRVARDLRGAAPAGRRRPHRSRGSDGADRRLSLSAPASSIAADGRRRADPQAARRTADGIARLRALSRLPRPDAFAADLTAHLSSVERHYAELFEEAPSLAGPGNLVFTGTEDDPGTLRHLVRGSALPIRRRSPRMVRSWHHGRMRATRSQRAREILTELVPALLRIFGATPHPDEALRRFDQFLSHLPAGVQLFSLFQANPGLLALGRRDHGRRAAPGRAVGAAPGAARRGADARVFRAAAGSRRARRRSRTACSPARADFVDTLDCCGAGPANGGSRSACSCCVARSTASGGQSLRRHRRDRARGPAPAVEAEFARRHGRVPGGAFAVIGMGRLGSREMTLASDLDLILIYDAPPGDRGLRRRAAALGRRLLRATEPAPDRCDHRADRRGPALRGRYAAAALGRGGTDRLEPARASPATSANPPGPGSIWR